MDFTWKQNRVDAGADPWGLGLALGGRVGITDNLGVGGRFEYLRFDDDAGLGRLSAPVGGGAALLFPFGSAVSVANMYGLTFVADYMIVDGLTLKGEMTWERASAGGAFASAIYPDSGSSGPLNNDQIIFILQMIYEF